MGRCNYCSFQVIKERAKERGLVVKTLPGTWGMGGVQVFLVPADVSIKDIRTWQEPGDDLPNGDENWQKYASSWFMDLPEQCCC